MTSGNMNQYNALVKTTYWEMYVNLQKTILRETDDKNVIYFTIAKKW